MTLLIVDIVELPFFMYWLSDTPSTLLSSDKHVITEGEKVVPSDDFWTNKICLKVPVQKDFNPEEASPDLSTSKEW